MPTIIIATISALLSAAALAVLIFVAVRLSKKYCNQMDSVNKKDFDLLTDNLAEAVSLLKEHITSETSNSKTNIVDVFNSVTSNSNNTVNSFMTSIKSEVGAIATATQTQLGEVRKEMKEAVESMRKEMQDGMTSVRKDVTDNLTKVQTDNKEQLEKMRETVDEKLSKTLNDRISTSFEIVNKQLLEVQKGFGEMQNLSEKVGNLNKVFNNVKTTGNWGEVALETLLEQILSPEQYSKQVTIKKNREMVDFVVIMPGGAGKEVWLPIDAKFPTTDYINLVTAEESANAENIASSKNSLYARIKTFAKDINKKYIDPPATTNFAIMYLPTEGLYAEIVRNYSLCNELQNELKIIVCGPTTITALLNSLQIGFTTLKIQKQSGTIVELMKNFRKDFAEFTKQLSKVKDKASGVVTDLDIINKRNDKIQKTLGKVVDINIADDGMHDTLIQDDLQNTNLTIEEDSNEM